MIKKVLLFSLPLFLFAKTVSFQEVLELTLANNKELQAKELDVKKQEQNIKIVQGYNQGKLEFSENISRTNNAGYVFGMKMASREAQMSDFGFTTANFATMSSMITAGQEIGGIKPNNLNKPDARNNFETKIVYEVPLFTGYKLENAKVMAQLQAMALKAKFNHDKKRIGIEVLKAYNGAVTAKRFIKLMEDAKIITNRFTQISQDMYNDKLTRIIDVKQAKMAGFNIDTKIKEAKTEFSLAISYLQFLTSDYSIDDVQDFETINIDIANLKLLQANAIKNRDDYAWMKYNTATMKKKIVYDSSSKYPTIGAYIEYGMNDDTFATSLQQDYYLGAIGLTYTLFDGSISKLNEQKSKIDYAKTKKYFEYMKEGISLEVKKNFLDYITKLNTLKDKQELSTMASNILVETKNIYKNNLKFRTNMMYLLMGLENMLKAQANVITSQYELTLSAGLLQVAIGKSLRKEK